jgi:hypothetical protein
MLKLRVYSVVCPCCRNIIEIRPPASLVAERTGLTHRCSWCRRLLATTVDHLGPLRVPDVRVIGPSDRSLGLERPCSSATDVQKTPC